ncbi:MAG: hypothetical protein HQL20_00265 [Candidatus Omnitrophica bacterium]|nr:hypothetical protein [Candidatus Omnitrophota bacterium]
MSLKKIKKIVLVAHDNEGSARLFNRVTSNFPDVEFLLVIGESLYYKKSFLASVIKLLREASWLFVFVRFIELVKYKIIGKTLKKECLDKGIRYICTRDINAPEALESIRAYAPDLLISLFTMQIYKASVIGIPRYGAITSHPSILPKYRGLEVFFWVLANDEKETGVSVFFLNEKIDAGKVFEQEVVPITAGTTVASLYKTITDIGGDLLVKAVIDIDNDEVHYIGSEGEGSYYPMPDRASVRRFLRLGRKFF